MYIEEKGFVGTSEDIGIPDKFEILKFMDSKIHNRVSKLLYSNDAEAIVSDPSGRIAYFSKYFYSVASNIVNSDNVFTAIDQIMQDSYTDLECYYSYSYKNPRKIYWGLDMTFVRHFKTSEPWFKDKSELVTLFKEQFPLSIIDYDIRISQMYNTIIFNIVNSNLLVFITPTNIITTIRTEEHEDTLVALLNALVSTQGIESLEYSSHTVN